MDLARIGHLLFPSAAERHVVCNIILWRLISDHEHVQHIQDMRYNATQRNAMQCNAKKDA